MRYSDKHWRYLQVLARLIFQHFHVRHLYVYQWHCHHIHFSSKTPYYLIVLGHLMSSILSWLQDRKTLQYFPFLKQHYWSCTFPLLTLTELGMPPCFSKRIFSWQQILQIELLIAKQLFRVPRALWALTGLGTNIYQ